MKKLLLLFPVVLFCISSFAQNLKDAIKNGDGITRFYTPVAASQAIAFNGSGTKSLLGIDAQSELLLYKKDENPPGFADYRFHQVYNNIPVEHAMYIFHTRNGSLTGLSGFIVTDFDPQMSSQRGIVKIDANAALAAAVNSIKAKRYAWQEEAMEQRIKEQTKNAKASYKPAPALVWYNAGNQINPKALRLCYKVEVYALEPLSRAYYFIDAGTGQLAGREDRIQYSDVTGTANTAWSGKRTIHSDRLRADSFRLRDYTKGNGIITRHGEVNKRGQDYYSTSANWTLQSFNQAALDAHYGVSQTWLFYTNVFGRNSYDDKGTALYSYVNDQSYVNNAFWDGSTMNFNKRSTGNPGGCTGIDITGHELTHGVTQETCDLIYRNEPGGINESLSDIMGKSIQFWSKPKDISWKISNDGSWLIRDMANPNAFKQPDTYGGTYWNPAFDVHTLSGVGNFMFYLLVTGGSGVNDIGDAYVVNAIGLGKADSIIYRSQTQYLTPTAKYADWRLACIAAATDLYGDSSAELKSVEDAFNAVGIGAGVSGCDAPKDLTVTNLAKTSAILNWSAVYNADSYNLQYRPLDSANWVTISGIPANAYHLTGLISAVQYIFRVQSSCAADTLSGLGTSLVFRTLDKSNHLYCPSFGKNTTYEWIQTIKVNNYTNRSGDNKGYGYFGDTVVGLQKGANNTITVQASNFVYNEGWDCYIDYNGDGDLTDPGEQFKILQTIDTTPVESRFTIPANAKTGYTRLRIRMENPDFNTLKPCDTIYYGEVEDYTVYIAPARSSVETALSTSIKVVPNPVSSYNTYASITLATAGGVVFRLIDVTGHVYAVQKEAHLQSGDNHIRLQHVDKLPHGIFLLTAEQNGVIIGRTHLFKQ